MRRIVQFGHDEAGLDIVGIDQQRLPRAQPRIAIIALGKKHPRLGHAMFPLQMVIDGTSRKNRQRQNHHDAGNDPNVTSKFEIAGSEWRRPSCHCSYHWESHERTGHEASPPPAGARDWPDCIFFVHATSWRKSDKFESQEKHDIVLFEAARWLLRAKNFWRSRVL